MRSQGKEEILDLIRYFCQLRHSNESDLNIDEDVAVYIHNDIKTSFTFVEWGDYFQSIDLIVFQVSAMKY